MILLYFVLFEVVIVLFQLLVCFLICYCVQVQHEAEKLLYFLGEDNKIIDYCEQMYLEGSTTIYECEIVTGSELKGLQRKTHFGEAAARYRRAIGATSRFDGFVFPALLKLAETQGLKLHVSSPTLATDADAPLAA
jgi:hypothetical protein